MQLAEEGIMGLVIEKQNVKMPLRRAGTRSSRDSECGTNLEGTKWSTIGRLPLIQKTKMGWWWG